MLATELMDDFPVPSCIFCMGARLLPARSCCRDRRAGGGSAVCLQGWDPLEISSGSSRSSEVNGDPTALIIDQAESFGAFINFDIVVAAWK